MDKPKRKIKLKKVSSVEKAFIIGGCALVGGSAAVALGMSIVAACATGVAVGFLSVVCVGALVRIRKHG